MATEKPIRDNNCRRIRLARMARRRLGNVMAECRAQMDYLAEYGDDYSCLTGLARTGQKWAIMLHFLVRQTQCFNYEQAPDNSMADMGGFHIAGEVLAFAAEIESAESLTEIADMAPIAARLSGRMAHYCRVSNWPGPLNITKLRNTLRYWCTLRNTWKTSEHAWQWHEWPQSYEYLTSCPHHAWGCADGKPLTELGVEAMARIAAARLHRAYGRMVHRFLADPCHDATQWRMETQQRFDMNELTVNMVLKQGARNDTHIVRSVGASATPRQMERDIARLREELDKFTSIINSLTEQRDDARRRENFATQEYHRMEARMSALGSEKSLLVVWEPHQPPSIALDGNWSMADTKRLLRPLGRAIRLHQDQIRKKFLDVHGFDVTQLGRPTEVPAALLEGQEPDPGGSVAIPPPVSSAPLEAPPAAPDEDEEPLEESDNEEEPVEEDEDPEAEDASEEQPEPKKAPVAPAGWIDPPTGTAPTTQKALNTLRSQERQKRKDRHNQEEEKKTALTQSETHMETPGRVDG